MQNSIVYKKFKHNVYVSAARGANGRLAFCTGGIGIPPPFLIPLYLHVMLESSQAASTEYLRVASTQATLIRYLFSEITTYDFNVNKSN